MFLKNTWGLDDWKVIRILRKVKDIIMPLVNEIKAFIEKSKMDYTIADGVSRELSDIAACRSRRNS